MVGMAASLAPIKLSATCNYHYGGFPSICHNELHDITASLPFKGNRGTYLRTPQVQANVGGDACLGVVDATMDKVLLGC